MYYLKFTQKKIFQKKITENNLHTQKNKFGKTKKNNKRKLKKIYIKNGRTWGDRKIDRESVCDGYSSRNGTLHHFRHISLFCFFSIILVMK